MKFLLNITYEFEAKDEEAAKKKVIHDFLKKEHIEVPRDLHSEQVSIFDCTTIPLRNILGKGDLPGEATRKNRPVKSRK